MKHCYKSCYATYENGNLVIGNDQIERAYQTDNNVFKSIYLKDKVNDEIWKGESKDIILSQDFPYTTAKMTVAFKIVDDNVLTEGYLLTSVTWEAEDKTIVLEIKIMDGTPFLSYMYRIKGSFVNESSALDILPISGGELKIHTATLNTLTDKDCNTVVENTYMVLSEKALSGSVFMIDNIAIDRAILIVKDAPSCTDRIEPEHSTITVHRNNCIQITAPDIASIPKKDDMLINLYGFTVGTGTKSDLLILYKKYYMKMCKSISSTYIMSNTWGDLNNDAVIGEALIQGEIETGKKLGIDVVQLDDGWQTGTTMNSTLNKSTLWGSGYYGATSDFWELHQEKFPNGLVAFDRSGIQTGMWFSPDFDNDYANWEKDIDTLLSLHQKYHTCYFKLDGIKILNKTIESRLIKVIETVHEKSNGKITFNFDITNGKRLGFFYYKEYGNIFLENRYIGWDYVPYYPHLVMRSVWRLSKFIPTQKLQIEVPNNKRKPEAYQSFLAPIHYDIRYIFAIAMVGNPLMWMEMCNLEKEDVNALADIIAAYKAERDNIAKSVISPVGDEPDGMSFPGFHMENEQGGYYLLFREMTEQDTHTFDLPYRETSCVYTNAAYAIKNNNGNLQITLEQKGSFALLKYTK